MKYLSLLAMVALFVSSCSKEPEAITPPAETSNEKAPEVSSQVIKLKIEGMHSKDHCTAEVTKQLKAVEGVEKVEVDFEGKMATVEASQDVKAEDLVQAVKEPFKAVVAESE
jgi:copper chaperone CopZ